MYYSNNNINNLSEAFNHITHNSDYLNIVLALPGFHLLKISFSHAFVMLLLIISSMSSCFLVSYYILISYLCWWATLFRDHFLLVSQNRRETPFCTRFSETLCTWTEPVDPQIKSVKMYLWNCEWFLNIVDHYQMAHFISNINTRLQAHRLYKQNKSNVCFPNLDESPKSVLWACPIKN